MNITHLTEIVLDEALVPPCNHNKVRFAYILTAPVVAYPQTPPEYIPEEYFILEKALYSDATGKRFFMWKIIDIPDSFPLLPKYSWLPYEVDTRRLRQDIIDWFFELKGRMHG